MCCLVPRLPAREHITYEEFFSLITHAQDGAVIAGLDVMPRTTDAYGNFTVEGRNMLSNGQPMIYLKDISFIGNPTITNLHLPAKLLFDNCSLNGYWKFDQCSFQGSISFINSDIRYIWFNTCQVSSAVFNTVNTEMIYFEHCIFRRENQDTTAYLPLLTVYYSQGSDNSLLQLSNCTFESVCKQDYVNLTENTFGFLNLIHNEFGPFISLYALNITRKMTAEQNTFHDKVDCLSLTFPDHNFWLDWGQLTGRVVVKETTLGKFVPESYTFYDADREEELEDQLNFNKLMSAYSNFYFAYKQNLDFESANRCYIEMKNLETRKLEHIYRAHPGFQSFFSWKMNVLLYHFCDYGTNPVKAVKYSIYVMLIFSAFYFIFPNNWTTLTNRHIMGRLVTILKIVHDKGTASVLIDTERNSREYQEYCNFSEQYKEQLPKTYLWIVRPLFWISFSNYFLKLRMLQSMDKVNHNLQDSIRTNRLAAKTYAAAWILIYLVTAISIKALNAFVLSLNAYTTLGFGDIKGSGLSRYLVVIQGFIGYFLLTIFSVTLLNQLLQ